MKIAGPKRFEVPTLWFEARSDTFLNFGEFWGFSLFQVEDVAADLLVLVQPFGFWRLS
jgi:hypothetical protein